MQEKIHKNSRDRIKRHLVLTKRLWIFLVLGVVISVLGLIIGGVYFNIRSITTSSEYTEVLPTYVPCVMIVLNGVLVITLVWRRYLVQVFVVIVVAIGTGTFSVIIAILTGTHILQPVTSLSSCDYSISTSICACFTPYRRNNLELTYLGTDKTRYSFVSTSSCTSIQEVLPALLYTQIGLFLTVLCLCVLSIVLAYLVVRAERTRLRLLQEETYEEIFTVSGSSSVSDSDDDITGRSNHTAVNEIRTGIGKISEPVINFPISILKSTDKQNSLDNSRSNGKSADSERSSEKLLRQLTSSAIRKSRSCDSLNDLNKQNNLDYSSNSAKSQKGQGKLKEHRRRDKRAVTLQNLDTKQLMLILDLHKKYAEETQILKSQGNLNIEQEKPKFDNRRALTPQPYSNRQNTIPKIVRSHTPQPYQLKRKDSFKKKEDKGGKHFKEEIKQLFLQQSELLKADIEKIKNKQHCKSGSRSVPSHKQTIDVNSNSVFDPVYGINMNKQPRSRPSVQDHFLPKEPIRRQNADKLQLPPQPLTRQSSHGDTLPPNPIQRDGSAFYVVGSQLDISQNVKGLKTPGEINCEKAIRENFRLCTKSDENPYATPIRKPQSENTSLLHDKLWQENNPKSKGQSLTDPLPPYPNPPSYSDFVSISQDDSSVRTESQSDTYEQVGIIKSESSDVQNESRDRLLTGSSDDDVFESDKKPVYSLVGKRRTLPKMGVSADMRQPFKTTYHQPLLNQSNSQKLYDPRIPYHIPSNPICVPTENPYHVPSNIYFMSQSSTYRGPQTPSNVYRDPRMESPFHRPINTNFHYYEEIDNIETSFMYSEDMLPSRKKNNSQTTRLPGTNLTNGGKGFKPYRPITTIDVNGETLETMI